MWKYIIYLFIFLIMYITNFSSCWTLLVLTNILPSASSGYFPSSRLKCIMLFRKSPGSRLQCLCIPMQQLGCTPEPPQYFRKNQHLLILLQEWSSVLTHGQEAQRARQTINSINIWKDETVLQGVIAFSHLFTRSWEHCCSATCFSNLNHLQIREVLAVI